MPSDSESGLDAVGVLAEPLRRSLYQYVVSQRCEVSRHDAATALGVQRSLAAFHLDKLVEAGLLQVSYRRLTHRSGPGAGRPAKLYRRAQVDHAVNLPPRAYPIVAELLAEVVEEVGADAELQAAAQRAGRTVARRASTCEQEEPLLNRIETLLTEHGFEPFRDGATVRLHNCPFHLLARQFPPLICGMNLALIDGIVAGLGGPDGLAHLDPAPGRCCVAVRQPTPESEQSSSNTYGN